MTSLRYSVIMASHRTVNATEFKAKCLALLDEVQGEGLSLTITKRGVPVAQLGPPPKQFVTTMGSWKGRGKILGDIVNFETTSLWEPLKSDPE